MEFFLKGWESVLEQDCFVFVPEWVSTVYYLKPPHKGHLLAL